MSEVEPAKRYELHIADLLAIPVNRFDDFLIDLKKWHKAARSTLEMINTIAAAAGESDVPAELAKMVWVDDGKHEGKVIIKSVERS